MKKFAIGALSVVASMAFAMESSMENTTTGNSPVKVFANVDLNMAKISSPGFNPNMGATLAVGTDVAYMFESNMGAALGLDFNMLKGKKDGITIKNNYLDVPVSFVYNVMPMDGMTSAILVGPYFGLPMSKWDVSTAGMSVKTKANMAMGLNLETHTTWEMSHDFAIGAHLGFKYAFNDLGKDIDGTQKYWALGLGLSAKFL